MDPHCNGLNGKLENVLKHTARFMTRNSRETGSMTGIFEELKIKMGNPPVKKRRKDNRPILL